MALVLADRVRDTTTTTGTGTVTLSGTAPTGYQNFSVIGNANTTYYTINAGSQWEVGIGTYSSTGPTLARTTVLESSNANALVNFSAGTKDVFVTYPSDKAVYYDAANNVGIGTSSPSVKLDVNGSANFGATITTGTGVSTGDAHLELGGNRTGSGPAYIDLHAAAGTDFEARVIRGPGANGNMEIANAGTGVLTVSTNGTEKMRIDSSGNVMVGTTSATGLFSVAGVSYGSMIATDRFGILGNNLYYGTSNFRYISNGHAYGWAQGNTDGADLRLLYAGNNTSGGGAVATTSERLYITAAGNVGIGTSSPGAKLDVSSSAFNIVASRSTGGYAAFQRLAPSGQQAYDFYTINGVEAGRITVDGSNFMAFATGSAAAERMRIDSSGNVGIGTTSPVSKLSVSGSFDCSGVGKIGTTVAQSSPSATDIISTSNSILGGQGGNAIYVGQYPTTFASWIQSSFTNPTTATYNIVLQPLGGNVGIGTSAPDRKLDVQGSGSITVRSRSTDTSGITVGILAAEHASGSSLQVRAGVGFTNLISTGAADPLILSTNSAERMRVDTSGNVGIGTSSPGKKLDLVGQFRASGSAASGYALLEYGTSATATNNWHSGSEGDGTFRWYNGNFGAGTERMRITSAGNVGIGTSAPGFKLDVNGTGYFNSSVQFFPQDGFRFTSASAVSAMRFGSAFTGESTAEWAYNRATAATTLSVGNTGSALNERMRIDSSGNLLVGSSAAPSGSGTNLQVSNAGSARMWLTSTGNRNFYLESGAANALQFVDGTAAAERMRIDSSGNVGIGTSAPGAKLDVVGVSLTRTDSSGGSTPLVVRNDNSANNTTKSTGLLFQGVDTVGTGKNTGVVQCGPSDANYVTSFLAFQTRTADALAERMRINSDGQLLVGTTSGGRTVCINAADNWMRFQNPSRAWLIGPSIGTSFNIFDETGGYTVANFDTAGSFNLRNSIDIGNGVNLDNKIQIGAGRTGSNYAYIDLVGDTTYTDYGLRLIRGNTGANTTSQLVHRGTGDMYITAQDAAPMYFQTSSTTRMYIEAGGTVQMNGVLLVGRNSASTDVNTANDTGSFSVRGSTTTVAVMSFHRAGAYAINMGLGTDNVFRIGGWSASSNAFQMDGSGNLTMLGNVTAYSDARMKKDVETIDSALDLVSKMRGVRYTRTDTQQRGVGVIAQEMLEVCPEVVQQGIGNDDTLSVAYGNLVGVLIEAIKELRAEVAELKGK